eukprot:7379040-Prymnesium_polylepis.2
MPPRPGDSGGGGGGGGSGGGAPATKRQLLGGECSRLRRSLSNEVDNEVERTVLEQKERSCERSCERSYELAARRLSTIRQPTRQSRCAVPSPSRVLPYCPSAAWISFPAGACAASARVRCCGRMPTAWAMHAAEEMARKGAERSGIAILLWNRLSAMSSGTLPKNCAPRAHHTVHTA